MDDLPLDDAPPPRTEDPDVWASSQPSSQAASGANPFDAFDVFAAPLPSAGNSTGGLSLPAPLPVAAAAASSAGVSLGSPLISFSPVAMSASAGGPAAVAAVDDLLSFSPIAAPAAASALNLLDDVFLGAAPASGDAGGDIFGATATSDSAAPSLASASLASSASSSSSASTSFLFASSSDATAPPPAPLSDGFLAPASASDEKTTATSRASFSAFDTAPASNVDAFTDFDAPRSAPAAFNDGILELTHDSSRDTLAQGEHAAATPESEESEEVMDVAQTDPGHAMDVIAAAQSVESPTFEPTFDTQVTTTASLDSELNYTSDEEAPPVECAVKEAELPAGFVESQVVVEEEVVLAAETAQCTESELSVSSGDKISGFQDQNGRQSLTETPASDSTFLVVVDATEYSVPAAIEVTALSEHNDILHPETVQSVEYVQPREETQVSEDAMTSELEAVESEDAPSALLSDIASPSSDAQELEGFQALSGESNDGEADGDTMAEPSFDAEVVALYGEVTTGNDETMLSAVDAQESVLHLHVREFDTLTAEAAEQNISSPASVVSSTGSSVAGSAFAFIAAGASSGFSFGQMPQSPSGEDEVSSDYENSSSHLGDSDRDSPEHIVPVATAESEVHDSDATAREDVLNWRIESPRVGAETQAADISDEADETTEVRMSDNVTVSATIDVCGETTGSGVDDTEATRTQGFQPFPESSPAVVDTRDDGFGDFGQTSAAEDKNGGFGGTPLLTVPDDDGFSGFGQSTTVAKGDDEFGGFGGLGQSASTSESDDGFGGFGQVTTAAVGDADDDFGDFGSGETWGSAGFESAATGKEDDDDFDDFTPAPAVQQWGSAHMTQHADGSSDSTSWGATAEIQPPFIAAPTDLNEFFATAFPACKAPFAASSLPKPSAFHGGSSASISTSFIIEQATALNKSFHASLQDYRSVLAGDSEDHHHQSQQQSFESEALRLKYLKYVLTEKMSEAARHDGVFPQGSEKYQLFEAIAESGHEKNMREALSKLQEALFQSSMNEAVMRIARQAALSAKARIAEQAAQQQAHARGSLLATTRNFLSRSGGSANDKDQGSSSSRTGSGSLGVLTPTSASVHKISRFSSSQNGQDGETGHSSGYGSGEDTGSEASVGDVSAHSEGESYSGGSGPPSSSSSSVRSGGLMKKFHERFTSLSSTKNKPRTVNLRRMGQSSEEVCKMELNMESINGGFDEVKWRCAGFLYETEEVARVAPSQIKIYSYPGNQMLTGKTDRSALSKFFKPGTTWSIDIGITME